MKADYAQQQFRGYTNSFCPASKTYGQYLQDKQRPLCQRMGSVEKNKVPEIPKPLGVSRQISVLSGLHWSPLLTS